jgi:oligopeptide transport system substrate-binding protein
MKMAKPFRVGAFLSRFIPASLLLIASAASVLAAPRSFSFRIPGEPETLDWNRAHTPIENLLLVNLMEGLVAYDSKMKVTPALATSWTTSPDGKTYTFKLRPGVKWSDGVPLKAQDFVYSWKRLLSPLTAASYAYFLFDIQGAKEFNQGTLKDFSAVGVRALDDATLQVKLKHPVAHWIHMPTFWVTFPLREDIVEKFGSSGWASPGKMVTVGPYMLVSHDLDSKFVLKANPLYYGQRGNIEQVIGLIITDDSTALSLYETGKLDFLTDISTLDLKRLAGRPDLKSFPYLKTGYLGFVVNKFPVSNVNVRRAIGMAIDKTKLTEVLHGGQKPASSFVPPPLFASSTKVGLPFDPARAKKELQNSGLEISSSIKIELILPNWDKTLTVGEFIQGQLKQNLGLTVEINPFDNKTFRAQLDLHSFPLFEASWSADYPDPDNFLSMFLSDSGNNRTLWKNSEYDRLVLAARTQQNQKAREKNYLEAQKILLEKDVALIPLYYEPNSALVRPSVKGLEINPLNYLLLRKVSIIN